MKTLVATSPNRLADKLLVLALFSLWKEAQK